MTRSFTVTRDAATPPQYPYTAGCRFYAVAALELLDMPGEYHIDRASGTLYSFRPMDTSQTFINIYTGFWGCFVTYISSA